MADDNQVGVEVALLQATSDQGGVLGATVAVSGIDEAGALAGSYGRGPGRRRSAARETVVTGAL